MEELACRCRGLHGRNDARKGEHLECAKACGEEVSDIDMTDGAWEQRSMVWRFLKAHTINDARKVVTSTPNRNCWETWRKLHLQYEPLLVMRGAVTVSHFTSMVNKRARSPAETKVLLLEMDERARRVEEVTGEPIGNNHRMSVVMGIIDPESMKHTAAYGGVNMSAAVLQKKIIEFASLMSTSSAKGSDAMDLGRLEGQRKEATAPRRWADQDEEEEWEDPWLAQD